MDVPTAGQANVADFMSVAPGGPEHGRLRLDEPAGSFRVAAHHGELLQGVFEVGGRLRRGLVTLPCPLYGTRATFLPSRRAGVIVRPAWRTKARRAAELALDTVGGYVRGGLLDLTSDIPLGRGFGSSTADVTAAIGAVVAATGGTLPRAEVARIAVAAEHASDSLMYGRRAMVFAHREGEPIEDFGDDLISMAVLGFSTGDGSGVDTLRLPPARYNSWEIEAFRPLLGTLRHALRAGDVALLGRVATASTLLNQRHLPVPKLAGIQEVAAATGAAGVQVAHSGDIAGLLFDLGGRDLTGRMDEAARRLRAVGVTPTWRFETGG